MLANFDEISNFILNICGTDIHKRFLNNIDEMIIFARSEAMESITDKPNIEKTFKVLSEQTLNNIIKDFLKEQYGLETLQNDAAVEALNIIKKEQTNIINVLVAYGIKEFTKGQQILAGTYIEEQNIYNRIKALELKLPNLSKKEAEELKNLYRTKNNG